eukprot:Transcript_19543.p2 GENE.Transcript_19543~~Transcript_19543.p2  ORF type:complete len:108 (+),score=42.27 Transcript_19543:389-712(+)
MAGETPLALAEAAGAGEEVLARLRELARLAVDARADAHEAASQEARTFDSTAFLAGVATAVVVYWGASRHLAPRHAGLLLRTAFRCGIWMPGAATAAWWVMRRMTRQ